MVRVNPSQCPQRWRVIEGRRIPGGQGETEDAPVNDNKYPAAI